MSKLTVKRIGELRVDGWACDIACSECAREIERDLPAARAAAGLEPARVDPWTPEQIAERKRILAANPRFAPN